MLISYADAKEVKRRARALHDHEALQDAEQLRVACVDYAVRLLADGVMAATACAKPSCKRKRRCAGMPFRCASIIRKRGVSLEPVRLIDGLYWLVLQDITDENKGRV